MRLLIAALLLAISYAQTDLTACDSDDVEYDAWTEGEPNTRLDGGVRIDGYQVVTGYEDCQQTCDDYLVGGVQCNGITYVTTNNRCFMHSSVEGLVESDLPDRISSYRPCLEPLPDYGCGPGNAAPSGCDSACGSTAVYDECGVCGGSGIADGACDCAGNVDEGCGCGISCPDTPETTPSPLTEDDWPNQFDTCTTYNGNSCSGCLKECTNQPGRLCCYNSMPEEDCSCLENHKWCGAVTITCSPTQQPAVNKVETTTPEPETTAQLCGNGMCDDGEELQCPTDCPDEVTEAVCGCIVEADMCAMTCPAIIDLEGECFEYGAAGICGMVIDINAEYYDVCDECVRPTEPETTTSDPVEETTTAGCDVMDLSSMGRLLERPFTEDRWDKVGRRAREIIRLKNEMNYDQEALDAMYNIRRFWKNQEPSEFYWNKMINNYNNALETECAVSEVGIVANIEV